MGTDVSNLDTNFEVGEDDDDDFLLASVALEQCLASNDSQSNKNSPGVSGLCADIDQGLRSIDGFDVEAGKCWIYPTNYPIRNYQFSIVQKGLFNNTLVSLPTGLGKTFIAAVIMYNFYRWYPQGKVVFMAPTKPLVAQQIEACFNVMGIPQQHMLEMTGAVQPNERKSQWRIKRVFFLTPQIMSNDISRGICQANMIKCLVIDEAHKALGNHAYAVVVKELAKINRQFRILALSATPGGDIKTVQQIITNLLISNVEIRTEHSLDLQSYVHRRNIETIVVPLSKELEDMKRKFVQILKIYMDRLAARKVLFTNNPDSSSKFMLLKEREKFRQDPPENLPRSEFGKVEGDFALAMSLFHAYELLLLYGMRSFFLFLKGITDGESGQPRTKGELQRNALFRQILNQLDAMFGESLAGSDCQMTLSQPISHPKMQKVLEIVLDHFRTYQARNSDDKKSSVGTRVIVFAQYRDCVQEITALLDQHQPLIKPMSFLGQASTRTKGFTQKLQMQVVHTFRNGGYNTLVSTCIGEEGLDIGEVDLIICYDAHKSPIRLVQRMGRTGRKRDGRVITLVTQGKEERIYNQGQHNKRLINNAISKGSDLYVLYHQNPRMIPDGMAPVCHQMHINSGTFHISTSKQKALGGDAGSFAKLRRTDTGYLTDAELRHWSFNYKIPQEEIYTFNLSSSLMYLTTDDSPNKKENPCDPQFSRKCLSVTNWLPWQNVRHPTYLVSHTKKSNLLISTLQYIQLHGRFTGSDDAYELELAPFLNKSDVVDQGTTEDITRIADYYPVVSLVRLDSDTSKNRTRKSRNVTEKEREAFFDLDEDFSMNPSPGRNLVTVSDFQDSKNPSSNPLMGCKDSSIEKPCSDNNNQTLRSDMKHCMKSEEAEEEAMFFKPPDGCMNPFSLLLSNNNNINDEDRIIIRTPPPLPPEDSIAFEKWFETFHYPKEAQFGNRDEEIVPHYPLTPPNVVCSWNENQLWDDEFCDPIPWKTPSKEQSVQNVVDCSKRLMNECQDTTSRVLVAKENNNSVLKESLYGTTQLLDLLNDSHSLNKSVNSKLHDNSCRICDKNVCDESTTNFTLSRRESDSCLSAKFQRNSPTWDQYSNLLINFNLNDNEEEVSSMNCEDISNADIIPPSPDCKLDQKTCISVKQELERISEMDKNSPLYLNGHRVSPIIGTMFLNHTSPSLSRLNVNSSSTPLNTAGSHSKVNSNTTSCVEAKHSDSWKQGTKTSSKNLNSLFDDSSGRGIILKKNRKRKAYDVFHSSPGRYFIDDEAEVTLDVGSDEEVDGSQRSSSEFEGSFIDDRDEPTQLDKSETTTMAMYLRTVRSPVPQAGAFAIRKPVASGPQNHELHSNTTVDTIQEARSEESDYEQDSFCVNSDSVEFLSSPSEVDIQRQEYFKSPTSKPKIERAPKRKRIFVLNDTSSSEEETSHNAAMDSTGLSHSLLAVCSASTLESKQEQLFETCNEPLKTTSSSSSHSVSPQKVPISFKATVRTSHCAPVVLVDSRELSSAQTVISDLRLHHHCEVRVVQLGSCDYIVSNRMAVERMLYSDITNNVLRRKLLHRIRDMLMIYEKSCLIIEMDYVKPNQQSRKEFHSKYYANTLACLSRTPIKLLFSNSKEHTANLLFELSKCEQQKGFSFNLPVDIEFENIPSLPFYLTLPKISFVTALNYCQNFKSVMEFMNSSVDDLIRKGEITKAKAEIIYKYLHHQMGAH